MGRKKGTNRSTVLCLYSCLKLKSYPDILNWTENEREFSIMFRRKGSNGWDSSDLDFFKEMDSLSPSKKERYFNQSDYELGCKRRCKANLQKMCKDKILEFVEKRSINKSTKLKYYSFLEIPNEEEYKHFLVTKKRGFNNIDVTKKRGFNKNIDVTNKRIRCNFSNLEGNNNEIAWNKEYGDVAYFLEIEGNTEGKNNKEIAGIEIFDENSFGNSNGSDIYMMSEMEEFRKIKDSLPGYLESPKNSLTESLPFFSEFFIPKVKHGMKIEEVANIL